MTDAGCGDEHMPRRSASSAPWESRPTSWPAASAFALLLIAGCGTSPLLEPPLERLSQPMARATLERAQQAYDEGDYAKAISTLKSGGAPVFEGADPAIRQEAMKLEAFSYCVANQVAECRTQFRKLLDAFPAFDLSVAEGKHPMWGPVFQAAKRPRR